MKNTIANRVADFLKRFPPFDLLTKDQILKIAKQVKIKYVEKSEIIYAQNDVLHDHFYLINKGAVSLKKEVDGLMRTIDKFDDGDVFGLRPIFANENYAISANADEECILYAIPIDTFKPLAEKNKKVGQFLIESFASNTENPYSKEYQKKLFDTDIDSLGSSNQIFELQPVKYVKKVITARLDTEIKEVAILMRNNNVGSIIIEDNNIPVGIVTDKDFRNKVATGIVSNGDSIKSIMSVPVLCYPKNISIAQAQITMMKHNVSHLCITKDGTPNTKIVGVIAHHDIILMKGANPAVMMKAIKCSKSTKELKRIREKIMLLLDGYIQQNIPLTHISKIIFELNDATIKRIIERCIDKMDTEPPVKFAWISLGSQGRKEQLLHTDQDNAIIFEDVEKENVEKVRAYFLALAKKVNKRLDKIGFEFCPADMMAKNPKWCLSLSEWKQQFSEWTSQTGADEILLCSIFFDFDITYGSSKLTNELATHIFKITQDNEIFISKLAASALRSPSPLSFFRQFLVEQDGAHKDFFNLKIRGLMPITDAGRVLALHYQLKNITNTAERFEQLAELVPENKELYLSCSYTSKALLKFKTKHGLLQNDGGSFIELSILTKEEKMKLKRCFKTLSGVQELIKVKFKINNYL
ncbi:MAG: CBS domain-containing protein [Flavobacteriaceae bacterium]|jgi:CBS domain-containing protein